ncbi:MAG: energy transducer TonB [Acidobacteriota bacterium]|nr:energy transducer TonB [Acidobacteriota bacterium]
MRYKIASLMFLVIGFGLSTVVSAQTETTVKRISGGVLNGKAASLPKPAYPAAARAVNASGAVNVQVTIDENGDIISANAVSGHPLLRQVSEQAARAAKFLPTKLQGQPVSVTGIIVYNFVMPMTFTQIGYELSLAEKSKTIPRFQISSISGTFPKEWEEEKEALKNLELHSIDKTIEKTKNSQQTPPVNVNADRPVGSKNILTVSGTGSVNGNYLLDDNAVLVIRELQSKIENRLSVNENILWSFKLGVILGKLKSEIESDEKTRANILELDQIRIGAPNVSDSISAKIKEITESSLQITTAADRSEKLLPLVESLRNARLY